MYRKEMDSEKLTRTAVNECGFSLVEILVAMLLLSVMVIAFFNLFDAGLFNVFSSGQRNDALELAFEKMERLYARTSPTSGNDLNTKDDIHEYLTDRDGFFVDDGQDPNSAHPFSFYLVDTANEPKVLLTAGVDPYEVDGVEVTIVVFYLDTRTVSLTGFLGRE